MEEKKDMEEKIDFEKIHNCEKCRGKIVCIDIDKLGVSRCGYCNEVVNYKINFKKYEILKLKFIK